MIRLICQMNLNIDRLDKYWLSLNIDNDCLNSWLSLNICCLEIIGLMICLVVPRYWFLQNKESMVSSISRLFLNIRCLEINDQWWSKYIGCR